MSLMQTTVPHVSEAHAVLDMADLVRREGQRLYSSTGLEAGMYQSMLCGLTISFQRGGIIKRIKAHDIDVEVTLVEAAIEQDDGIERNSPVKMLVTLNYCKGNAQTLAAWHRDLCAYRQSMRSGMRETIVA